MSDISWETALTYVAGGDQEAALMVARQWNQHGASGILNFLGEHLRVKAKVKATLSEYLTLIPKILEEGIKSDVAIKPSQLGLEFGMEQFNQNLRNVLEVATDSQIFVWIDMEKPRSVEPTLKVFRDMLKNFGPDNIGICVQANLRRTPQDLTDLVGLEARIRLVKGVYHGTPEDLLPPNLQVNDAYRNLMEALFETSPRFALGTHAPDLIEEAILLNQKWNRDVEWEMLLGVMVERQLDLLARGLSIGIYIPFGSEGWKAYTRRRLLERRRSKTQ